MDFVARHRFSAAPQTVVAAMIDPGFVATLSDINDVGSVEVIDRGEDGSARWISARLSYDGSLDPLAARVLGSDHPTWVQTYRLDVSDGTGRLDIEPDHHGALLRCSAEVRLVSADGNNGTGDRTDRTLRGDLKVRVPLLGGKAEQALMPAILVRIDAEAALLEQWLTPN